MQTVKAINLFGYMAKLYLITVKLFKLNSLHLILDFIEQLVHYF